jgi:hypothetical protein
VWERAVVRPYRSIRGEDPSGPVGCGLSVQFHKEKDETSFVLSGRVLVSQGKSPDALTTWKGGLAIHGGTPRLSSTCLRLSGMRRSSSSQRRSLMTSFVWRTDTSAWVTPRHKSAERPDRRSPQTLAVDLLRHSGGKSNRPLAFRALLRRSSQITAYRRISARIADCGRLPRRCETPASGHIRCPLVSETGLIAMQKVESSNLFSRFTRNLALGRDFVVYRGASGK